jgi:hypothetical protein
MKIRNGFVSNSSSSSFIVHGTSDHYEVPQLLKTQKDKKTLKIPQTFGGEYQFGRERQNYYGFANRLNWAVLQALYVKECWDEIGSKERRYIDCVYEGANKKFLETHHVDLELLYEVLKEELYVENIINEFALEKFSEEFPENPFQKAYIDHGSNWHDKKQNVTEIFGEEPDKNKIFEWLFNSDGYICNRSDEYEDYRELEVDHRYDYHCSDDFYNNWDNKDKFDKKGNFIE